MDPLYLQMLTTDFLIQREVCATITLPVTASESLDTDFFEVGAVGEVVDGVAEPGVHDEGEPLAPAR